MAVRIDVVMDFESTGRACDATDERQGGDAELRRHLHAGHAVWHVGGKLGPMRVEITPDSRMVFTTGADAKVVASESENGDFVRTITYRNGGDETRDVVEDYRASVACC